MNSVTHSFDPVLIKRGVAILNFKLWVVNDSLTFRPKIPTSGGLADDVAGQELGKSNFRG